MIDKEKKDLKKDLECVDCKKLFFCEGKPRNVDRCLNYEKRKDQK